MSSSNQPLRHKTEISKDLVLYLNTKFELNPIKQRDFSLFFCLLAIKLKQSVLTFSENCQLICLSGQNYGKMERIRKRLKENIMSIDQLRDVKLITALITPFHEDGSINYDALPELIEHLLAHHTEALLLAGTTAESPTLTHDEELELFAAVQKIVNGRVPLIAGVGTNDTRDSIEFAKEVAKFGGFAAGLAIVPYYNKPSQEGMYQHFKAIADASDLPIIIYNIPGRVVVEMAPDTMLRLAEHPNIIGVKECTSLANMAYLIEHKPEDFLVYTGEDGDAFHAMNLGANGVISVASHTNGDEMHAMLEAIENSDLKTAAAIQRKFIPKVNALFSVPSPAPVKAVLNHVGFEVGPLRLPLVACTSEEAKRIIKVVLEEDVEATRETVTGVVRPDY